jgi:MFS family permease
VSPTDIDRQTPAGRAALTVTLLGGSLAVAFELYGTVTAMPAAAADLGRLELYAWAFTGFVIAQVLAIVLAGRVVDRIGPVLPLMSGTMVFIIGLLMAGLAPSMLMLLIARFVQGFGGGALNLAFMVVIAQAYDFRQRAWLMSALSFCWMLPSFVGPPLAAWITTRFSWHWVFLAVVPFLLIVAVPGVRPLLELHRTRAAPERQGNPVPIWAAFAGASGAALLQLTGQRLDLPGLGAGAAGLVILAIGLPYLMPPGTVRLGRGLPAVMVTRGLACGAFFSAESFLPLLLIEQHQFSLTQAGIFLAIGSTGWTLGSVVQASRRMLWRRDHIIQFGAAMIGLGLGLAATAIWFATSWVLIAAGFVLAGTGMGLLVPSTSLVNMQISEAALIGRNTSSLQVAEGLGNSLVTGMAGTLFAALHLSQDAAGTFGPIYAMATVVGLLTLAVSLRIGPVRNESSGIG